MKTVIRMAFPFPVDKPHLVLDRFVVSLREVTGANPEFEVPASLWKQTKATFEGLDSGDELRVATVAGAVTFRRVP